MTGDRSSPKALICFLFQRTPRISTLFPYTTLFRSWGPSWAQLVARARGFRLAGIVDAGTEARKRAAGHGVPVFRQLDRKSTRLNSSHPTNSYAVVCFKKKKG